MEVEGRPLRLESLRPLARGNTAEIFRLEDGGRICKLFHPGYPAEFVMHEFANARTVFGLGINTPRPHELVRVGSRHGIVYDRVFGKDLYGSLGGLDTAEEKRLFSMFVFLR